MERSKTKMMSDMRKRRREQGLVEVRAWVPADERNSIRQELDARFPVERLNAAHRPPSERHKLFTLDEMALINERKEDGSLMYTARQLSIQLIRNESEIQSVMDIL